MARRIFVPPVLLALALLAGCDSDATSPEGTPSTVNVRVYIDADASGGFTAGDQPVSGATVTLTSNEGTGTREATTGSEGIAAFTAVEPGSYTATLTDGDALPSGATPSGAESVTIRAPFQGAENVSAEIRFVYLPSSISGQVYRDDDDSDTFDPEIDTPAQGFEINLHRGSSVEGDPLQTTSADSVGAFRFALLSPGEYTVEVVVPNEGVSIVGGATRSITLAADVDTTFVAEFQGTLLTPIAEAKEQSLGSRVTVEGVVTVAQGSFRDDNTYIQDASSGIQVFGLDESLGLEVGDSVRVEGELGIFNGQLQIVDPVVTELGTGTVPSPLELTASEINALTDEGELARVRGATVVFVGGDPDDTAYNVALTDPAGIEFDVRVSGSGVGIPQTFWQVGSTYDVTGVIGSFRGSAQLLPRAASDVTAAAAPVAIRVAKEQPLDSPVTVVGVVTVAQGSFRDDNTYIQDSTSGIQVFGLDESLGLEVGDSVRVSGAMGAFNGQLQIVDPAVVRLGAGTVPEARVLTGEQINALTYEGELARVPSATVTAVGGDADDTAYNVTLTDAAGTEFDIRVSGSGVGIAQTFWQVGSTYDLTGVLGSFRGTAQLQPRSPQDVTTAGS